MGPLEQPVERRLDLTALLSGGPLPSPSFPARGPRAVSRPRIWAPPTAPGGPGRPRPVRGQSSGHTPLFLLLSSIPSGAAAETGKQRNTSKSRKTDGKGTSAGRGSSGPRRSWTRVPGLRAWESEGKATREALVYSPAPRLVSRQTGEVSLSNPRERSSLSFYVLPLPPRRRSCSGLPRGTRRTLSPPKRKTSLEIPKC